MILILICLAAFSGGYGPSIDPLAFTDNLAPKYELAKHFGGGYVQF